MFAVVLAGFCAACSSNSALAGAGGWQSSKADLYRARFVPDPEPPATGQNALDITLEASDGKPVEGATIAIEPWMPAHGHGSSAVPVVQGVGGGSYHATELVYTMPGQWELRVDVSAGAGDDQFAVPLDVQ